MLQRAIGSQASSLTRQAGILPALFFQNALSSADNKIQNRNRNVSSPLTYRTIFRFGACVN
jgi:hypothetical protein